ncbi:MAG TPA: Ca2+-dependent phosphoinositide-specific phospholipase C [Clostridia bacterium]|nr:Ca2+-dependent phosphoinositide-specific phospholipase C [Clostridia bacterium]
MQTSFLKVLSLIFSIIMVLPQVPRALVDHVQNTIGQTATQFERLEGMRNEEISIVNEQGFANFDLSDTTVKYNEIRTLTTHNSYKKALSESFYSVSSQVFGPEKFKSSMYEHDTPVAQLNNGVRGLELDIRWQLNGFKIFHVPLVDNLSNSPDWKMTLEELHLWSDANPNHVPVTVLIEIKQDKPYLNLLSREMDEKKFLQLDRTIKDVMGVNNVITAADLLGEGYGALGEMVENNGWPTLCSMKGKFIFLLHPNSIYTEMYINLDTSMKTQVLIPVISKDNVEYYHDYAAFVLGNNPYDSSVSELVGRHYVVRTRMDSDLYYDADRRAAAMASGAQLLTTDFEKGLILPQTDYPTYLEDTYTIIL